MGTKGREKMSDIVNRCMVGWLVGYFWYASRELMCEGLEAF